MNALKSNFDKSLDLYADVILNPSFPEKDFDRLKKQQVLAIKQEQSQPVGMAFRILPKLLYGKDHAYSNPYTGNGYEETVNNITRDDLVKYHQTWFAPNHATLLVVGDITPEELKTKLEAKFSSWKKKDIPTKNISTVKAPSKPEVYIIDKPGALQSVVFAAELSPSSQSKDWVNMDMMNRILGGEFTSRINMNLREDKHWSYGSYSVLLPTKGQGIFTGYAPVQTDKTKESVIELKKELDQYVTTNPPTKEEFDKVQENAVLQLPGGWETNASVLNALQEEVQYNRGNSYWPNYASMIRNLSVEDMKAAAKKVIDPSKLTWVIVGDKEKIEKGIRDLNIGDIHIIDTEGKEVKAF